MSCSCNLCNGRNCWNVCGCNPQCGCRCRGNCDSRPFITLCGVVRDASGRPLANQPVQFTINGVTHTVCTNANGQYTLKVLRGTRVTIRPETPRGVTVTPASRTLTAGGDRCDLDFVIESAFNDPVICGRVRGLRRNAHVPVCYWINGEGGTAYTDERGCYRIIAPYGACVVVRAAPQRGYTVRPCSYCFERLTRDMLDCDFTYHRLRRDGVSLLDEADEEVYDEMDDGMNDGMYDEMNGEMYDEMYDDTEE